MRIDVPKRRAKREKRVRKRAERERGNKALLFISKAECKVIV